MADSPPVYPMPSTVYGPVPSWRFGNSLGVDLIVETSTCSFNCIYCQLGHIQRITAEQRLYVPTARILADLEKVDWSKVDVVTFSGSGEPTLATNIDEVIAVVKDSWRKPVMVLTNATLLHDAATRRRLWRADTVACKLDTPDEDIFQRYNRPAEGITLERVVEGIRALKADGFPGRLALQCMFMPINRDGAERLAELAASIGPDEIHLNTPRRPYPREWYRESRGNHTEAAPVQEVQLKVITLEEAREIEEIIKRANPDARVLSVYTEAPH
ncbi:MAG: radical SAM protein [Candidatus Sumerlaeia bacterium]|nr:radical SAM protein [Candidatus Sumerlaeia bacterium]